MVLSFLRFHSILLTIAMNMVDSIQQQDPPLWLAAATRTKSLSTLPNDFPIIDLTPEGVFDGPLDLDQDERYELGGRR